MPRRGENIYKRKDGRWEGRYRFCNELTGEKKYRSVYAKSYQEVKQKLVLLRSQTNRPRSAGNRTVHDLFLEWIQQAISELCKGKTLLFIAHRLNTIAHADKIMVIKNGQIAESGNHETLMH